MTKYKITIADSRSIFCAIFEVRAMDVAMAVFRAMAQAGLNPLHDYLITSEILQRTSDNGPAVTCVHVDA